MALYVMQYNNVDQIELAAQVFAMVVQTLFWGNKGKNKKVPVVIE